MLEILHLFSFTYFHYYYFCYHYYNLVPFFIVIIIIIIIIIVIIIIVIIISSTIQLVNECVLFLYFPSGNIISVLFLHGFDPFIHIVSFIILLQGRNILFCFVKKFFLQMIGSQLVALFICIAFIFSYISGLLVVGVIFYMEFDCQCFF